MQHNPGHVYDCIIVGAGFSGISAARELLHTTKNILVISPDVGGRYVRSKDGVNYGAYFCSKSYSNLKPYLTFSEPILLREVLFHSTDRSWSFFSPGLWKGALEWTRLYPYVVFFRIRFARMRRRAIEVGQAQAIREDAYLDRLFHMKATEWFEKRGVKNILKYFIDEMAYSMSFTSAGNHNAFYMLQWTSEVLCRRLYKVDFNLDKFSKRITDFLVNDRVSDVSYESDRVKITSGENTYHSKSVIIATAPWDVCKLVKEFPEPQFASAYMYHIKGRIKPEFAEKKYNFFNPHHAVIVISAENDGTFILYSRHPFAEFEKYFDAFDVIKTLPWTPAIRLKSERLYDEKIADNVYQASTFNIDGLEDAYINGLYCARQIRSYLKTKASQEK